MYEKSNNNHGQDNTARHESLSESNGQLKATTIHLRESINHLEEINKDLITKYDKQKEFISIAAHELRSPIMPILGTLELLEYEFMEANKNEITLTKERFEMLVRNATRLERLVSDILDITKMGEQSLTLKKADFNLNDVVLDIIEDHRTEIEKSHGNTRLLFEFKKEEKKRMQSGHDSAPEDIFVYADKNRINQIISNLLTNAIKFTNEGVVSISVTKKEDEVILAVKDTGIGIHPEILPRLFSMFATMSEGTGLGLFISKNIVEAHGGKIWGENNNDGKGATFGFSLPSKDVYLN